MFTTKHSIGTLYLSLNGQSSSDLARNLSKRGFPAFTIVAGLGYWNDQPEPSYVVTIVGETTAPAYLTDDGVLMPPDPTAFEYRIRNLAENLALDYGQECVATTITPCLFELTTPQAAYRRNG